MFINCGLHAREWITISSCVYVAREVCVKIYCCAHHSWYCISCMPKRAKGPRSTRGWGEGRGCFGVQLSRDSIRAFNDGIKRRENRGLCRLNFLICKINFIMKNKSMINSKEVIIKDGLQETCLKKLATFFKMRGPLSIFLEGTVCDDPVNGCKRNWDIFGNKRALDLLTANCSIPHWKEVTSVFIHPSFC